MSEEKEIKLQSTLLWENFLKNKRFHSPVECKTMEEIKTSARKVSCWI